ncbi:MULTISPECIES: HvfA family oxazolone/thioamide-modified RiPP metallophore [Chryseobacterium]|uniref:Low-complexity protein n=1 Tax=Chryseobacterium camelliae TaxID=1265445 RepID=A0ABU0TJ93_9FLAO|nr:MULTISPECIES: hypothetical protein [Chryseobacterium]MDT3409071.1 putative low-complexity protein [Pseudacidovorax intermedius]MDQ1097071.1 putative low-complexity protein [Chryseobacterium camelliae]MDQ1101009.1 putative low-complexity protein [Chryseobacterium sp. SORGH_AS_1048]MDR6084451.1 putative low-complexity protein [Chryseobacterium sp. SORGH_AS_0909]MDR6132722.1 putative low-complexity protein [Chryseobacterium sp. SORGH_AS_1175]
MNSKTKSILVGAAILGSFTTSAKSFSSLGNGYEVRTSLSGNSVDLKNISDGKCGDKNSKDGKCGEGKCGGKKSEGKTKDSKCGGNKAQGKTKDSKCGEGKCGGKTTTGKAKATPATTKK